VQKNPHIDRRSFLLSSALLAISLPVVAQFTDPRLTHQMGPLKTPLPAPAFSLKDIDGKVWTLDDFRGKVLLMNFWATWCPPCRREMPSMERLQQAMKGKPFSVVAVNQQEDADRVFEFVGALQPSPTFPILLDGDAKVAASFGVRGLPTSLLVDKTGQVTHRAIGGREFDHPDIVATIEQLLK